MTWDLSKNGLARTCVTIESAVARDEKEKKKHDELIQSARARIIYAGTILNGLDGGHE